MTEPHAVSQRVRELLPGLLHWTLFDDRIDSRSDAYALRSPVGTLLIDPLPLSDRALTSLGEVAAICLTIQSHQRSSWRYRRYFGVEVWAPRAAQGLEEEPEHWYDDGDRLPGGLTAMATPGPAYSEQALLLNARGRPRVAFLGDLVTRGDRGVFGFVPDELMDAPERARLSVRRLLSARPEVLCPGHGAPALRNATEHLRRALELDRRHRPAAHLRRPEAH